MTESNIDELIVKCYRTLEDRLEDENPPPEYPNSWSLDLYFEGTESYPIALASLSGELLSESNTDKEARNILTSLRSTEIEQILHINFVKIYSKSVEESDSVQKSLASLYDTESDEDIDESDTFSGNGKNGSNSNLSDDAIISSFDNYLSELVEGDSKKFRIIVPLNINESKIDRFKVHSHEFKRATDTQIKDDIADYVDKSANNKDISSTDVHEDINQFDHDQWDFWEISINCINERRMISEVQSKIMTLLGKINFTQYHNSDYPVEQPLESLFLEDYSQELPVLQTPPFLFIYESGEIIKDIRHPSRTTVDALTSINIDEQFEEVYSTLNLESFPPEYQSNMYQEEIEWIESSLWGFHRGVTADTARVAFMNFWRALEDLSLKRPQTKTNNVLNNILHFHDSDQESRTSYEETKAGLSYTRNRLVHTSRAPAVLNRDVILLREIYLDNFESVREFCEDINTSDFDLIQLAIKKLSSEGKLDQQLEDGKEEFKQRFENTYERFEANCAIKLAQDFSSK